MRFVFATLLLGLLLAGPPRGHGQATGRLPQGSSRGPDARSVGADGPLREGLFDPILAWESADVVWVAPDGESTARPRVGASLLEALAPGGPEGAPGGTEAEGEEALDRSLVALVPSAGHLVLCARSGEVLAIEGPAAVRLVPVGRTLEVVVRRAASSLAGSAPAAPSAGFAPGAAAPEDRGPPGPETATAGEAAIARAAGPSSGAPPGAAAPGAIGASGTRSIDASGVQGPAVARPPLRLLPAPEGWREGPWATVDAGRTPDFRPPWAAPLLPVALETGASGARKPDLDLGFAAGLTASSGAAPSLPSRAMRATGHGAGGAGAARPDDAGGAGASRPDDGGGAGAAGPDDGGGAGAARPDDDPPRVVWRSAAFPPDGRVDLTLAVEAGEGDLAREAVMERWLGLAGGVAPLALHLGPGRTYRLTLTHATASNLTGGRRRRALQEVTLDFETLSEEDAAAVDSALAGLAAMAGRLGEPAVAVLSARLLETWGLDSEARSRWWALHAAHSGHPQGPALLARAFAAPPER